MWEESRALPNIVGKVELGLENLNATLKEDWFPLVYARAGAYVSGDLHVRIDRMGEKLGTIVVTSMLYKTWTTTTTRNTN